ncbi:MAG: DUF1702 family protein [Ktedonobacteraceae bacterium]
MALSLGKFLKPFFRISTDAFRDMAAKRYGAQEDMYRTWQQFEPVAGALVQGFSITLDDSRDEVLMPRINALDIEVRGVAYEGVGMGLTLLDSFFPWKNRLREFVEGAGASYICLVYIGAGLVLPRIPGRPERFLARLDPLLRWFVMDGYGFYEGFFSLQRSVEEHIVPRRLTGYARRAFDHGLGRSIWFSTGANVERICAALATFPQERQADLWGGIGMACAYAAGVVDRATIKGLLAIAGPCSPQFAVGVALAAKFRQQAGTSAPHTELACEVVYGLSGNEVAHLTDVARESLPVDAEEPAYEIWRQRIAAYYSASVSEPREVRR